MATHAKGPAPPRVVALTCARCGFDWEHVRRPGGQPTYCPECQPLALADWRARKNLGRSPRPEDQRARAREHMRLRYRGYTHAWKGLTEQQWVDRWNERPDLFLALVKAIERSVMKYPDPVVALEEYRRHNRFSSPTRKAAA